MHIEESTYTLTALELKALLAHASDDETRPQLCAVAFRGSCAYATDGHRMARLDGEGEGIGPEYLCPTKPLALAVKAAGAKGRVFVDAASDTLIATDAKGATVGTFAAPRAPGVQAPPYEVVLQPSHEPGHTGPVGLNPEYLGDLALARAASPLVRGPNGGKGKPPTVAIQFGASNLDPVRCTVGPWLVVIMPMRLDPSEPARKAA
ncbi:MAG: hypothetical protein FJ298_16065 [Planctomycetes bacterium]|nr:hypothetical protein [Planctomycetota bacterium]